MHLFLLGLFKVDKSLLALLEATVVVIIDVVVVVFADIFIVVNVFVVPRLVVVGHIIFRCIS